MVGLSCISNSYTCFPLSKGSSLKKKLLLYYKSHNDISSDYHGQLIVPYTLARPLHSSSAKLLLEPKLSTNTYGDRAFSIFGQRLWNRLPNNVPIKCISIIYSSKIRPVLEYACPVWHGGITAEQSASLEHVQEHALRIAYPGVEYEEALKVAKLSKLCEKCKKSQW